MAHYRAYVLNAQNRILHGEDAEAADDAAAALAARRILATHQAQADQNAVSFELWQGRRLVFRANRAL